MLNDLLMVLFGFVGAFLALAIVMRLCRKWAAPTVVKNAKVIEFRSNLGPKLRILHKIGSGVIVIDHQLRGKRQKIEIPKGSGFWCKEGAHFSKETVQTTSYNFDPPSTEVRYTPDGQQVIIYTDGKSTPVHGTEVRHTSNFWVDIYFQLEPQGEVFTLRYNAKLEWCKALQGAIEKIIRA